MTSRTAPALLCALVGLAVALALPPPLGAGEGPPRVADSAEGHLVARAQEARMAELEPALRYTRQRILQLLKRPSPEQGANLLVVSAELRDVSERLEVLQGEWIALRRARGESPLLPDTP